MAAKKKDGAPSAKDLDALPAGVAMALAARYGIAGYKRADATTMPATAASE